MAFTTDLLCFSYACSTQNPEMIEKLRCSNKILLPESMLFEITKDNHDSLQQKLYFKLVIRRRNMVKYVEFTSFQHHPELYICHII